MVCLLGLALGLVMPLASWAVEGFGPQATNRGTTFGQGVYFAGHTVTLYSAPSLTAPVLDTWQWQTQQSDRTIRSVNAQKPIDAGSHFLAFYPGLDVAMLAVVSEAENGWVEVATTVDGKTTAWLPLREQWPAPQQTGEAVHAGVYQSWLQFIKLNARSHGIYWLTGVSHYDRALRQNPDDRAKLIPMTIIKDLRVLHARGNWLLVEATDINRSRPIGWVRWRTDDGQLLVFANFSGDKQITLPTGG
jgi:hypothetical protein